MVSAPVTKCLDGTYKLEVEQMTGIDAKNFDVFCQKNDVPVSRTLEVEGSELEAIKAAITGMTEADALALKQLLDSQVTTEEDVPLDERAMLDFYGDEL